MAKNERGEEMLQPNKKTVLEKYCVFAPDGLPIIHTIALNEETSIDTIAYSMGNQSIWSNPDWKTLKKWGASCQKVTITIEING